jgi:hypothetical protein
MPHGVLHLSDERQLPLLSGILQERPEELSLWDGARLNTPSPLCKGVGETEYSLALCKRTGETEYSLFLLERAGVRVATRI